MQGYRSTPCLVLSVSWNFFLFASCMNKLELQFCNSKLCPFLMRCGRLLPSKCSEILRQEDEVLQSSSNDGDCRWHLDY